MLWRRPRLIQQLTGQHLMQERAESHCHCCLVLCCWLGDGVMLLFHLFASEKINRLVLSGALVNIKSLVPISLSICHK